MYHMCSFWITVYLISQSARPSGFEGRAPTCEWGALSALPLPKYECGRLHFQDGLKMDGVHIYCKWECLMIKKRCPNHGIDVNFFHLRTGAISLQVFSTFLQTRAATWTSEHADWTKAVCLTWATKWGYHIPKVPLLNWHVWTFF